MLLFEVLFMVEVEKIVVEDFFIKNNCVIYEIY